MICLLPNCAYLSETSRMLAIHDALQARGADVRVGTHGGPHERALRAAGVDYEVVGPRMSDERAAVFVRSGPGIGPPGQSFWSDDELHAYVAAEAAWFGANDGRVAVTGWTLTALLSTRLAGIPLATEHAGSMVPPVFERGLLPTPLHRLGVPLERFMPDGMRRRLANAGMPRLTLYTDGFNRVAAELGVEGVPSLAALLLGDLTLVTDVPDVLGIPAAELEAWTPRDPSRYRIGTRLRYTGAIYARLPIAVPERVERFLAGGGPIVYVAITSSTEALVRDAVAALRPLGTRILVAGTVHRLDDLEDERVLVGGVLPSHEIMPRVDLAVTAGGQGSVQSALVAGTPLVGIPLQPEQHFNVVMAERHGAARVVPPGDAGGPRLAAAARDLLADDGARAAARRLQALYAAVDGPAAAAEAILELAAASAPRELAQPPGATPRRASTRA
jgi:UDP:flavonoid glycosyltransferase YjiC (YdhE family)